MDSFISYTKIEHKYRFDLFIDPKNKELLNDIMYVESFIHEDEYHSMLGILFSSKTESCLLRMQNIEFALGYNHEWYIALSNFFVERIQKKMIGYYNDRVAEYSQKHSNLIKDYGMKNITIGYAMESIFFEERISFVLDGMYLLGKFRMNNYTRASYERNFEDMKSSAQRLFPLYHFYKNPKEKILLRLTRHKQKLIEIQKTKYFQSEYDEAIRCLRKKKRWHLFRSKSNKSIQVKEQEGIINQLMIKSENKKQSEILETQKDICDTESIYMILESESSI